MKAIKLLLSAVLTVASIPAIAGGFLTNTNQSVSFLRMPAQEAVISVDGAYFNPAGVAFLDEGFHIGGNWQAAFQTRQTTTEFAPLAYGEANNLKSTKKYTGKTTAPFIPSLDLAYVKGKFAVSAHFGIIGGGGSAVYNDGIGTFETAIAAYAAAINQATAPQQVLYGADIYVNGTSFFIGSQINAAYRITDWLSASLGIRGTYALANYDAYIHDITLNGQPAGPTLTNMGMAQYAALVADRDLKCDQNGFALAPILGVDVKAGKWNIAARYEFREKLVLKNSTEKNTTGINSYDDGVKARQDIPSLLAIGIGYSVLPELRLFGAFHSYGDKAAHFEGDREDLLGRGCLEGLFGVEYDLGEKLTLSTGVQYCSFDFGKDNQYLTDMSFNTNSTSVGIGGKYKLTDKIDLECGYFHSFYQKAEQKSSLNNLPLNTRFFRTSDVLGLGLKARF